LGDKAGARFEIWLEKSTAEEASGLRRELMDVFFEGSWIEFIAGNGDEEGSRMWKTATEWLVARGGKSKDVQRGSLSRHLNFKSARGSDLGYAGCVVLGCFYSVKSIVLLIHLQFYTPA
jgi:hypothetical protein